MSPSLNQLKNKILFEMFWTQIGRFHNNLHASHSNLETIQIFEAPWKHIFIYSILEKYTRIKQILKFNPANTKSKTRHIGNNIFRKILSAWPKFNFCQGIGVAN